MNGVEGALFNLDAIWRKFERIAYSVHACSLSCKLSVITSNKHLRNVVEMHFHTIPILIEL